MSYIYIFLLNMSYIPSEKKIYSNLNVFLKNKHKLKYFTKKGYHLNFPLDFAPKLLLKI